MTTPGQQITKDWVERYLKSIHAVKEEICQAFLAKYGCEPDEAEIIEWTDKDGVRHWHVQKGE